MSFEHCHFCKPPVRHAGCHSDCPYYAADISKLRAAKEEKRRLTDAKCDRLCARQFKTQRYQRLKGQQHAGVVTCVADSPTELARLRGTTISVVSHALARAKKNPESKSWYVSVWTEWSDAEYEKYFGRRM
mgnify:CR=1 FL=1|jgi:hypothetical protein